MPEPLWWVYGVIAAPASLPAELRGVEGQHVELVQQDSLATLASPVPADEFSGAALERRLNDLGAIGAMARGHEQVLDSVLAERDVVPLKLCTLYLTQDALRAMLVAERERLLDALQRVRGAVELGVKVFAPPPRAAESERPASGTQYLAARLAQRRRQADGEASLERSVAELHARLTDHAASAVLLRPQDRRLSGREQEMLLNGAYLVHRTETSAFAELVESLGAPGELGLEITGPWPPYHFAEVRA